MVLIASFFTFSTFFNVADTSTYKDDKLLNGFACSRLGLIEEQIYWANEVLREDSVNIQAIRLKLVGFTNLVFLGKKDDLKNWNEVIKELEFLTKKEYYFEDTILLTGCYLYKFKKDREKACQLWIKGLKNSLQPNFYKACLVYTGLEKNENLIIQENETTPLLLAALEEKGIRKNIKETKEVATSKMALHFLLD